MSEQDRDQRTEDATPQRILKARQDGQVAVSADFLGGVILATCALLFWGIGEFFFGRIGNTIAFRITEVDPMIVDPRMLVAALIADVQSIGMVCLAIVAPLATIAVLVGVLQTNFNVSLKPLNLDWKKLSVVSGFGRIFSSKSVVRGGLSVAKAAAILLIAYLLARSRMDEISVSGFGSFRDLMYVMCQFLLSAGIAIGVMMLVVGVIDLAFQKWKHLQDLKMSIRDIKDEHKESDGDPQVKARLRQLRAELSRKRMLSDVPKASVVITNPTHFAVAIQYDPKTMDAPIVLAKGADFLAKKIIDIAKENDVAVVERKPVARFLYANAEVGSQIPIELYQAVAEILNFVNKVRAA